MFFLKEWFSSMKPWTTWNANSVFPSKWRATTDGSPSEGNMLDYIFALEGFFSPLKFVMKLYTCSLFLEKTQIWANLQLSFSLSSCPRFCLTVQGRETLSLPCCCECVSASLDAQQRNSLCRWLLFALCSSFSGHASSQNSHICTFILVRPLFPDP